MKTIRLAIPVLVVLCFLGAALGLFEASARMVSFLPSQNGGYAACTPPATDCNANEGREIGMRWFATAFIAVVLVAAAGYAIIVRPARALKPGKQDRDRFRRVPIVQLRRDIPLFAIAAFTPLHDPGPAPRHDPETVTMLVPLGMSRHVMLLCVIVGGMTAIALVGGRYDKRLVFVAAPVMTCLCWILAWLPAFFAVNDRDHAPLDEHFRATKRTERASLLSSVGLMLAVDTSPHRSVGRRFTPDKAKSSLCTRLMAFAIGVSYGLCASRMLPRRLRSLSEGHEVPRYLHGVGMTRVIVGRPRPDEAFSWTAAARTFLELYFGYALVLYCVLLVSILATVFLQGVGRIDIKASMHVLVMGLFCWWALVSYFAVYVCGPELRRMRGDIFDYFHLAGRESATSIPLVPRSSEEQQIDVSSAGTSRAQIMLDLAERTWIPAAMSVAGAVLVAIALTMIQALGL